MARWLITIIGKLISIPVGLTLLYLLLPTANSGIDGYAYAASIKWGYDLIWPHHLLYVPFGRILFLLFPFVPPLVLMKLLNALAAGAILVLLQKILIKLQINYSHYFVLFAGSCFGLMRYATENENYILPIFWCLLATYYFIKFLSSNKNSHLLISGLLFGLGVLFHQIHIFWYIGFAIPVFIRFNFKQTLMFMASGGLLVLSVYLWAYNIAAPETGFIKFILHDVFAGQVNTGIGINNFIMAPISFIRTFIQVHGYMKPLLAENPVLYILPLAFAVVGFICLKSILKHLSRRVSEFKIISNAVLWAFGFQLLFAFYSVGNAEFMVMLPILIILWLVINFDIPTKPILYISLMLLFWNLVFGLAPLHYKDMDGSQQLLVKMEKYPNAKWLMSQPQKMENMLDYTYGKNTSSGKIYRVFKNDTMQISLINRLAKDELLTDCLNNTTNFGRRELTFTSHDFDWELNSLTFQAIDSITFFGGENTINRVMAE